MCWVSSQEHCTHEFKWKYKYGKEYREATRTAKPSHIIRMEHMRQKLKNWFCCCTNQKRYVLPLNGYNSGVMFITASRYDRCIS